MRKRTLLVAESSSKKAKSEQESGTIYTLSQILGNLPEGKVTNDNSIPIKDDNLEPTKALAIQSQLGHFISMQLGLMDQFTIELSIVQQSQLFATGAYDPKHKSMLLNMDIGNSFEIIQTFVHEGVHAIDNLHMGVGFSIAIPALAKLEQETGRNLLVDKKWYIQAQNILDSQEFSANYGLKSSQELIEEKRNLNEQLKNLEPKLDLLEGTLSLDKDNLRNTLEIQLSKLEALITISDASDISESSENKSRNSDSENSDSDNSEHKLESSEDNSQHLMEELKKELNQIVEDIKIFELKKDDENYGTRCLQDAQKQLNKNTKQNTDSFSEVSNLLAPIEKQSKLANAFFHKPFTEFAAHSIENLHRPSKITEDNWKDNNDGRQFLEAVTMGIYINLKELDSKFKDNYPAVNQAFIDKLVDLRHRENYRQKEAYIENLNNDIDNIYKKLIYNANQELEQDTKNEHLKRANKSILAGEGWVYNLNESLFAANVNYELLNIIDIQAIIEASITTKYIDTLPSLADNKNTNKEKVQFISEDNHSTQHGDNTRALITQMKSGEINSKMVIALELKQYGESLGMKDVIKLANVISHNEKYQNNPDKQINIPPEINKESLIYQESMLYKVAKENGVKIIGLEGKNLGATKQDARYNQNREQYMADVIHELSSKGYHVIASIGSSHTANIQKYLNEKLVQNKPSSGFSKLPRHLQEQVQAIRASTEARTQGPAADSSLNPSLSVNTNPQANILPKKGKNTPSLQR